MLEGEIYSDETRLEGPFGEFMGYYASNAIVLPIVNVRRVYYRNNPILTPAIPSRPPKNFTFARAAVKAAMICEQMEKAGVPGVQGVCCHESGARCLFDVVSIKQMYAGHTTQAGMVAANFHAGNYAGRWVIVVDEDIDPSNLFDVTCTLSTRYDPPEEIQLMQRAWSTSLVPMVRRPPYQNNRAVVDCCLPREWKDPFPILAEAGPELKARVRAMARTVRINLCVGGGCEAGRGVQASIVRAARRSIPPQFSCRHCG